MTFRIYDQKQGKLTEAERYELARLLLKAGYRVDVNRERPPGTTGKYVWYIECEGSLPQ